MAASPLRRFRAGRRRPTTGRATGAARVLVVANAALPSAGAEGPRPDFVRLAELTGGDLVTWDTLDRHRCWRWLRARVGFSRVVAFYVTLHRRGYDSIWCSTEVEGLLLALMLKASRGRAFLVINGLELMSSPARILLKRLKVWTHIGVLTVQNSNQHSALVTSYGVPADRVRRLPYQVDTAYFDPATDDTGRGGDLERRPLVVMVGRESRDVSTFLAAVGGLDVDVHVAASSAYARDLRDGDELASVPPNVTVGALPRPELRDLYRRADLAVLCLFDSPYDHGQTAINEAMSMALPVVVTRTRGQTDTVVDEAWPSDTNLAHELGAPRTLATTGVYVPPEDPGALAGSIDALVTDRTASRQMGAAARQYAVTYLDVDRWAAERAALLRR